MRGDFQSISTRVPGLRISEHLPRCAQVIDKLAVVHSLHHGMRNRNLLPPADQGFSALIEDLDARGLLDSTLIVALGEFGRTPTINQHGGRDHWPDCFSAVLAGGGIMGGRFYGSSDRMGAYPDTNLVVPGDLAATIFHRFGLDPATELHDLTGRPFRLAAGEPLVQLFGSGPT